MTITHPSSKIAHDEEKKRKADQKRLPPSFYAKMRAKVALGRKQQQPKKPPIHPMWKVQTALAWQKQKHPEKAHPVGHKRNVEDLLERDSFDLD